MLTVLPVPAFASAKAAVPMSFRLSPLTRLLKVVPDALMTAAVVPS